MRKASLWLSISPFAIALVLLSLLFSARELDSGVAVLLVMFFSLPVLMTSAVVSVVLAFKKTDQTAFDSGAKVMSVVSAVVFVPLGAFAIYGLISVVTGYSQYMAFS